MSTGTSRTQNQGIRTLRNTQLFTIDFCKGRYLQDSHSTNEPEILLAGDVPAAQVPGVSLSVPDVAKDGEAPSIFIIRIYP